MKTGEKFIDIASGLGVLTVKKFLTGKTYSVVLEDDRGGRLHSTTYGFVKETEGTLFPAEEFLLVPVELAPSADKEGELVVLNSTTRTAFCRSAMIYQHKKKGTIYITWRN
jgi:hypothetical protein